MKPYRNLGGDSAVVAYEYWDDFITVEFESGKHTLYTYTYTSAGNFAIETMKQLADAGHWLNSYIATHKPWYASRA
jgi:hypothetical protein